MFIILYKQYTQMELIFENAKKGGALAGAGSAGLTGAGRKRGSGLTGASSAGLTGAGSAGMTGAGKKYDGRAMGRLARHHTRLYGAGWFDDFVGGFKDAFTGIMDVALPIADMIPGVGAITTPLKIANRILGGSKSRRVRGGNDDAKKEGELAFKEMFDEKEKTSAPVGGRKPNKRAEIVKKVMAKKGLSLPEASKYVKAHNLY